MALNQFHVLSSCPLRRLLYTDRHNKALDPIVDYLKTRGDVFREPTIKHEDSTIKPDIILVEPSKPDTAIVLDLQVTYERSEDSFEVASSSKIRKYLACFRSIRRWLRERGWPRMRRIKVKALIFGGRGSIFRKTLSLLKDRFEMPRTKISTICSDIFDYSSYILAHQLPLPHADIFNSPHRYIDLT